MEWNIPVKRVYPYGKHESHVYYWASLDESLTFTDKEDSQGYWECDQTGKAYQFDHDTETMVVDLYYNCDM